MIGFGTDKERIVAGLDGSPRQAAVVKAASELAKAANAELHLVRAVVVPPLPAEVWTMNGDELIQFLLDQAHKDLETAAKGLDAPTTHVTCRVGTPADVLCSVAKEVDADLVVLGTHGYGGLDRVLGTTAAKVVNRAPTSVLVIRE